jgi:hypothetical protein
MRNQYKILAEKYNLISENNVGNVYYMSSDNFTRGEYEYSNASLVTPEEIKKRFYYDGAENYYGEFTDGHGTYEETIQKLNNGEVVAIYAEESAYTFCKDKDTLLKHNKDQRREWVKEGGINEEDEVTANNEEEAALNKLYNQIKARELLYKDNPGINIDI